MDSAVLAGDVEAEHNVCRLFENSAGYEVAFLRCDRRIGVGEWEVWR